MSKIILSGLIFNNIDNCITLACFYLIHSNLDGQSSFPIDKSNMLPDMTHPQDFLIEQTKLFHRVWKQSRKRIFESNRIYSTPEFKETIISIMNNEFSRCMDVDACLFVEKLRRCIYKFLKDTLGIFDEWMGIPWEDIGGVAMNSCFFLKNYNHDRNAKDVWSAILMKCTFNDISTGNILLDL